MTDTRATAVFDTVVVGAGVVGLAIARAEALRGRDVVVLERESRFGTGASSRNSEVIHAGIYNPTDTWKTRLCVTGRPLLYRYCAERGIDHRRTGKLLVATDEDERATLGRLLALSSANGLTGEDALVPLSPAQAREVEPEVSCIAAALSPSTGIVAADQLMRALLADGERHGAHVAYHAPVEGVTVSKDGFTVRIGGERGEELRGRRLVNAAGLGANELARRIEGADAARVPRLYLVKGSYFSVAGASPFQRPVYPTRHGGLSVHATIDLGGQLRLGPDAEYVPAVDYAVDPSRAESFYRAVRRFWPGLPGDSLRPAHAGIRAKLSAPGEPWRDFAIDGPAQHGIAGLIQLFGIESPGLTACLALADLVAGM